MQQNNKIMYTIGDDRHLRVPWYMADYGLSSDIVRQQIQELRYLDYKKESKIVIMIMLHGYTRMGYPVVEAQAQVGIGTVCTDEILQEILERILDDVKIRINILACKQIFSKDDLQTLYNLYGRNRDIKIRFNADDVSTILAFKTGRPFGLTYCDQQSCKFLKWCLTPNLRLSTKYADYSQIHFMPNQEPQFIEHVGNYKREQALLSKTNKAPTTGCLSFF